MPPSFGDKNDIILEVSAGVGGQEAMLFTKELFEMYKRYADFKGWTIDTVNFEVSDIGMCLRNCLFLKPHCLKKP